MAVALGVREMTSEDLSAVAALSEQLGYPVTLAELEPRLDRIRGTRDDALFVAELPDGSIAGWIHVGADPSLTHDSVAEIKGLIVSEFILKESGEASRRPRRGACDMGFATCGSGPASSEAARLLPERLPEAEDPARLSSPARLSPASRLPVDRETVDDQSVRHAGENLSGHAQLRGAAAAAHDNGRQRRDPAVHVERKLRR